MNKKQLDVYDNINKFINTIDSNFTSLFREQDITKRQMEVLELLPTGDVLSQAYIKRHLSGNRVDLTRLLDRLKCKGYIEISICEFFKSKKNVKITKKGINIYKQTKPLYKQALSPLNDINDEDADVLNKILNKINND